MKPAPASTEPSATNGEATNEEQAKPYVPAGFDGIETDHALIRLSEDGEFALIRLKRPLTQAKHKTALNGIENERLGKDKSLEVVKMRVPRVFDRLAVAKLPGAAQSNVVFEFQLITRITDLPAVVMECLSTGDWENLQEAMGKLTD